MTHFQKNNRRGNAAIFALTLVPILGFGSLSIDVGFQRMTAVQVQAACEAGSAAGATYLNGQDSGLQSAIDNAIAIANLNFVQGDYTFVADDVQLGNYEEGVWTDKDLSSDPETVNAVRVTVTDHSTDSILSRVAFGVTTLESGGEATSVQPRGGVAKYVDCYLPFAIPQCHFTNLDTGVNPLPLNLNLSQVNTVGFGGPNGISQAVAKGLLVDQCSNGTAETWDGVTETPDSQVDLMNGIGSAVSMAATIINGLQVSGGQMPDTTNLATPWPSNYFGDPYDRDGISANLDSDSEIYVNGRWGYNIAGVVPITDKDCGENQNQAGNIVGWSYAYIYDMDVAGANGNVWFQFDTVNDYDIGYGQCTIDNGGGPGSGCEGNVTGTEPPIMVY